MKFYFCEHCKNLVEMIKDSGVAPFCCGQKMTELIPNTTDAANEKHVPVVSIDGTHVTVKVGSVAHPMMEAHFIQWILVETCCGVYRANLTSEDAPEAHFTLREGEVVKAVYEYCNLHGLWKTEL